MKQFPLLRFKYFIVILAVALQAAVIFAPIDGLLNYWFTTDDAFYYFKVAQNIVEGHGSTFDGIHLSNGYHPLWMLVMIPVFTLARFDLFLPLRIVILISILLSAGSGVLLYKILKNVVSAPIAMLAAVIWIFSPKIHAITTMLGMETGLNAFMVLLFLSRLVKHLSSNRENEHWHQYASLGVFAVLALFSRLDNAFLVLTAGLVLLMREKRAYALWIGVLFAAVLSVFLAFFIRLGFVANYPEFLSGVYVMVGVSVVIKLIVAYLGGLLTPLYDRSWTIECLKVSAVTFISGLLVGIVMIISGEWVISGSFPRTVIFYDAILTLLFLGAVRLLGYGYSERQIGLLNFELLRKDRIKRLSLWFHRGLAYALPVIVFLGAYLVINYAVFGTPSPVSGQVKHWWGAIPDTIYQISATSFSSLIGLSAPLEHSPWWLFFAPATTISNWAGVSSSAAIYLVWFLLITVFLFLRRRTLAVDLHYVGLVPLIAACLLQILYYNGSYYANLRTWYWSNEMLGTFLVWALALDTIYVLLAKIKIPSRIPELFVHMLSVIMVVWFAFWLYSRIPLQVEKDYESVYLHEARMLEKTTAAGSLIGMAGGGAAGYFIQDRTIINLDGLINSYEYFQHMKAFTARDYLDSLEIDFAFGHEYLLTSSAPYYVMLKDRIQPIEKIGEFTLFTYNIP